MVKNNNVKLLIAIMLEDTSVVVFSKSHFPNYKKIYLIEAMTMFKLIVLSLGKLYDLL